MPPKKIILSKLGVDELLDIVNDEDIPAPIRNKARRYLEKCMNLESYN